MDEVVPDSGLRSTPNKFIAIKNNSLTHGTGGKFCILIVKHHPGDGSISLESAEHRSQHMYVFSPTVTPRDPTTLVLGITASSTSTSGNWWRDKLDLP